MSRNSHFSGFLHEQNWPHHTDSLKSITSREVEAALSREGRGGIVDLVALLSPLAGPSPGTRRPVDADRSQRGAL